MSERSSPPAEQASATGARVRRLLVGLIVSVTFLAVTFHRVSWAEVAAEVAGISLPLLAASQLTKGMSFACMAARTQVLLGPVAPIGFADVSRSVLIGFAGNAVLPARGGEVLRAGWLTRRSGASFASVAAIVVVERIFDLLALGCIGVFALTTLVVDSPPTQVLYPWLALLGSALTALVLAARMPGQIERAVMRVAGLASPKLAETIASLSRKALTGLASLGDAKALALTGACTLGVWTTSLWSIHLWVRAFDLDLPLYAPMIIVAFVGLGSVLPSAPSNVGTWHYFAKQGLLVSGGEVSESEADSFVLVGHFMAFAPWTLLSIPLLFTAWGELAAPAIKQDPPGLDDARESLHQPPPGR